MKWEIEMKLRRSDRMVVISNYLINNPYKLTSLNTFAEKYESAKSSISEDIVIIKRAFEEIEIGQVLVKYTLKNILNILLKIFFIIIMHFC